MPRIVIKTLPLSGDISIPGVLKNLGRAVEEKFGFAPRQFVMLWEIIPSDHFLFDGSLAKNQSEDTHHPFIEITAVKGMPRQREKALVRILVDALARELSLPLENICVTINALDPGRLFVFGAFK